LLGARIPIPADYGTVDDWWAEQVQGLRSMSGIRTEVLNITPAWPLTEPMALSRMLSGAWLSGPAADLDDDRSRLRRSALLRLIIARLLFSSIGLKMDVEEPTSSLMVVDNDVKPDEPSSPDLPTLSYTESFDDRSIRSRSDTEDTQDSKHGSGEDPAITRLRKYAVAIDSKPARKLGESLLLSHWQLGQNPSEYVWVSESARRDAAERARRREKELARQQRRMQKRQQLLGEGFLAPPPSSHSQPTAPAIRAPVIQSSQGHALGSSSQPGPSSFSQTASQPVAGLHGSRPKKKPSKAKKISAFR